MYMALFNTQPRRWLNF